MDRFRDSTGSDTAIEPTSSTDRRCSPQRIGGVLHKGAGEQVDDSAFVLAPDDLKESDPFVLLDQAWFSKVGFDWHPHRGFETVTLVVEGQLEHHDNAGGHGVLDPGDLQWVTAGSGVIHAELAYRRRPVQTLQLWVNLPRRKKMSQPRYQNLRAASAPLVEGPGSRVRIFAGDINGVHGPAELHHPVTVAHAHYEEGGSFTHEIPGDHNGFLYVVSGSVLVGPDRMPVENGHTAWFPPGEPGLTGIEVHATQVTQLVFYSGLPIREPAFAYGPFVMNDRSGVAKAIEDYQSGKFGPIPTTHR
ncbi:pirin family protein [Streptomyces sp. NBC_01474]|uniref:pirin family protein n=1 Tax=Streptomyces sp. NBC_01474 TaxID=2903880 RepID=UPI002DD8BDD3|nr:pirin family protein [Streptomyces sp. NBC_01474]WSE01147.1 pirin family protein [Streptomyces sp. NBC_01474]